VDSHDGGRRWSPRPGTDGGVDLRSTAAMEAGNAMDGVEELHSGQRRERRPGGWRREWRPATGGPAAPLGLISCGGRGTHWPTTGRMKVGGNGGAREGIM
jgi:hypothetical protein